MAIIETRSSLVFGVDEMGNSIIKRKIFKSYGFNIK